MHQQALPLAQIAQLLDVPEDALRALMADRHAAQTSPQGDATLVGLTVAEAARRIGISRTKLYEYVATGDIPSVKIGRLRRIPAEAVPEFLARRRGQDEYAIAA
ncbi:helix-turn-helix domain-containing protein [Streptomyces sp. NBC_01795]|uniref:helix-turn-helix domain-containing protein n=1 Tax=Streptomyces sp. NBC_01795 TaxID=2975943 RepID=UPI002DDBD449|nr:helix-turn-helix domain-containing protein [Streptomyces sp. NBC_01795]WSA93337.1 helix-turn-helix domain-containing protein [Streptomyces sp. NBC_01795]